MLFQVQITAVGSKHQPMKTCLKHITHFIGLMNQITHFIIGSYKIIFRRKISHTQLGSHMLLIHIQQNKKTRDVEQDRKQTFEPDISSNM